jgi:hypothetical protein
MFLHCFILGHLAMNYIKDNLIYWPTPYIPAVIEREAKHLDIELYTFVCAYKIL